YILGILPYRGHLDTIYIINRITYTGILGDGGILKIYYTLGIQDHIFEKCPFFDGPINFGLLLLAEMNDLGIASPLKIKHLVIGRPAMFVITDQFSIRIRRQGCLPGAGKP